MLTHFKVELFWRNVWKMLYFYMLELIHLSMVCSPEGLLGKPTWFHIFVTIPLNCFLLNFVVSSNIPWGKQLTSYYSYYGCSLVWHSQKCLWSILFHIALKHRIWAGFQSFTILSFISKAKYIMSNLYIILRYHEGVKTAEGSKLIPASDYYH